MTKFQLARIAAAAAVVALSCSSAFAADTAAVTVTATVVGVCKTASGGAINFTLDPSVGGAVAGVVSTAPSFWCTRGTNWTLTDDKGLYVSGGVRRMIHGTVATEFVPYAISYTAAGSGAGPASPFTVALAGTVAAADYVGALAGSYSDTVTLSITP